MVPIGIKHVCIRQILLEHIIQDGVQGFTGSHVGTVQQRCIPCSKNYRPYLSGFRRDNIKFLKMLYSMFHEQKLGGCRIDAPDTLKFYYLFALQICCKCVRCTSCGTTTPGPDRDSVWTYEFSLCAPCGRLMDRGQYILLTVFVVSHLSVHPSVFLSVRGLHRPGGSWPGSARK